jgi:hypothetical protein
VFYLRPDYLFLEQMIFLFLFVYLATLEFELRALHFAWQALLPLELLWQPDEMVLNLMFPQSLQA